MRPRVAIAAAGALVIVASLGACSQNKGTETESKQQSATKGSIATDPKDSMGPAKEIPGAKKGGTLYYLLESDYEHLDPARDYVVNSMAAGELMLRTLTMFKEDGSGKLVLVGDLAETPGTDVNKDCKTWEYKIKKGIKYEDGTEVKAADVAYGIARSYSPELSEGAHYINQWLADDVVYNKTYKGPYNGGADTPPGLTVKDDYTLEFAFKKAHCDMPFAASMPGSTAVPKSKDTKTEYDLRPFSSGPYKVKEYKKGTSLTLVRNEFWDPKTDPVRHNYFDQFVAQIGPDSVQQSERILASNGVDQYAIADANVPGEVIPKVTKDSAAMKRTIQDYTPFVTYLDINTQRVKDLKVRRALQYAVDRAGYLQASGGPLVGEPASTIESPLTIGYSKYDAYPTKATGDPAKAKELLGGQSPKLVYGYSNTDLGQKRAAVMKESLEKAGFKIVLQAIDSSTYYDKIGEKGNPYDLYLNTWAADWPSGATVLPPLFDGRTVAPRGNNVYSYFNDDSINSEIDRISNMDAASAAPEWSKLDKKIITDFSPVVPVIYVKNFELTGKKVNGVILSAVLGNVVFYNAYLS